VSAARPVVCECCGASPHVGPCASVGLELLPGDCVFFQSDGFVAWAIRQVERWHLWRRCALFFTGRFRKAFGELEGRSYVNHVAMVVKGGSLMTALIMDAQPPIVRTQRLGMYTGDLIAVYRPNGIDDEKRQAMAKRALRYEGRRYGVSKILLHLFGLQGLSRFDRWPMCAWTYGVPAAEVGIRTSKESAGSAAPDSQWDWMRAHLGAPDEVDTFTCVRPLTILEA